jgi:hypothetical protein
MSAQDVLQEMIDAADGQVEDLEAQIAQIEGLYDDLQEERDAIEDGMLTPAANELSDYLINTKAPSLEPSPTGGDLQVNFGPTYNNLADIYNATITDWRIVDTTTGQVYYQYNGVGWDGDSTITKLRSDWLFGWDYLTKPLTDLQGNYGIIPNQNALQTAITQLELKKDKIEASKSFFGDYV